MHDRLQHMNKPPEIISYYTMRRAIGVLGITLPLILLAGSFLLGDCKEVQGSISTYYYTNMRNIFVGFNCAVPSSSSPTGVTTGRITLWVTWAAFSSWE